MDSSDTGTPAVAVVGAATVLRAVRDQAMFMIDVDGTIASWNEGVGLILQWEEEDFVGQPLAAVFTAEDIAAGIPEAEMRTAAANGRADDTRWMCRKGGERFFALGELTRMVDDAGHLIGYLKILRDDTHLQHAAAELERLLQAEGQARVRAESEAASLTAAIEAMADGVCVGDADSVRRCNGAAIAMFGADSAQALQVGAAGFVDRFRLRRQRDGPLLAADDLPYRQALRGQRAEVELWVTQPGGSDVCMRCAAAPIVVDGRIVGAVAVYTDRTDRMRLAATGRHLSRVETALRDRDAELRALVDGVRDYAIFTVDPAGLISSWCPGAALMEGYSAEEAVGMPVAELYTPTDRAAGCPAQEMAVAAATGAYQGEGRRLRKDGSTFDAAVVLTSLHAASGELRGYLALTHDVTERKQLERERQATLADAQAARAEAERTSRSKDEFLAAISHELRTPLAAIVGWAQVLERGVVEPETLQHGLAAISRNARTQAQLIEDLLDMSRIESGQLRTELQRIELGGVIAAAIDAALPAAAAKGIGLRTVFGPAVGPVMGDAARLQQVVGNLLNNAVKFTPSGGQISVSLTQCGDQAQIAVADTGQGIDPEFVARVFDRFRQQDATTTRRHGGLGIGLAIVKQIVRLHGGTVRAHSLGPGQGATFTVTLPMLPPHAAEPVRSAAAAASPSALASPTAGGGRLVGLTVLLVDDEQDVRSATRHVLQEAGARVLEADGAEPAFDLLERERPQVILSDIGMPGIDGYEFMRRVRGLPADRGGATPAAAFTAYTRAEDRLRARDVGYQLHLGKPVATETLLEAVRQLADRRRAEGGAGQG